MTHNVFDSCVPTFILAGQSNTLGHNIEARDLPPWLRACAAAFEAYRNSTAARAFARARVRYGGAFATATDADPVAPKPPKERAPARKASCADDLDGCGGPRARRRRRGRG